MSVISITPSSGAVAGSGNVPSGHQAPIPTLYLPGIALVPAELNYDQTVALVSDQFEIAMNDSYAYLNRVDFAALSTGLLDPYDPYFGPEYIDHLIGGVVDEIELHIQPNKLVSVLRGRDKVAAAIDSTVYITYSLDPTQPPAPEVPLVVPGFPSLPVIPGVTVPLVKHGHWKASTIAADLCASVGLSLVWDTHDYDLREDVVVNGPILSTLQSLVEPFSHFERSKVDIWAEDSTLFIRSRGQGGPGMTMDVHDARITEMVIRAKFNDFIRVLRIIGSQTGSNLNVAIDPGTKQVVTEEQMLDPVTQEIITRIVTTSQVRILDNAQKSQTVQTFMDAVLDQGVILKGHLVSLKETVSDWDDLALVFPNTIVNQPKEHSRIITESSFDAAGTGALKPTNRTTIAHHYSLEGFLTAQTTTKEVWDDTPTPNGPEGWVLESRETKQYQKNGAGQYQITTTQFGSDGTPGDCRRTIANGTPPGGPGRSVPRSAASDNEQQIVYATLISQEPGARDITINNKNLLTQHMTIIAEQAAEMSGSIEIEISFTAAGMPWIRRGQYITLTNLFAEDGTTPIPLGTALVTEARIEYRESSVSPTYLTYVKALFWE